MGSPIVYCAHCNSMLRDSDFEKGGAVHVEGRPYCTACAAELFPAERLEFRPREPELLPREPESPVLRETPRRGTRLPAPSAPPPSSGAGLWIGLGVAAAALVAIGLAVSSGGSPPPPVESNARILPPLPPPSPPAPRVPVDPSPAPAEDVLALERSRLEESLRGPLAREEFGRALEILAAAQPRRPEPVWSAFLEKRRDEIRKEAERLYSALERAAVEAKRRGSAAEVKSVTERVTRWGLDVPRAALEKALAAVAAPPPPPPPPAPPPVSPAPPPPPPPAPARPWAGALAKAAVRDYAGAIADLERAQLEADVQLLRQAAVLPAETARLLSQWPPDQQLEIEIWGEDGSPRKHEGPVLRSDLFRLEIRVSGRVQVVPYGEIAAASLAELFRNRKGRKSGDARTAALFCLLERDAAAARKLLGEPPSVLPERYWEHAAETPAPHPREADARRLFAEAEAETDPPVTTAAAAAKFATLLQDFADCAVVRRNAAYIAARAQAGREYFFAPEGLAVAGVFRWSRSARREAYWAAAADVEPARRPESFVEIQFSVLPNLEYKVWAFLGGCCVETMACHAQAGEQVGTDASTPVKHGLSVTRHRHASRREPTVWGWAKLAQVKAGEAGPQKVRLLPEHAGLCVSHAWVTAGDRPPPKETELKELERAQASRPGDWTVLRDPSREPGLTGLWRFDEGAGATAADASRSGNAAALAGPAWNIGVSGGALLFDGTDDRVTLASAPAATDTFTLAFWANPTGERKQTAMAVDGISGTADQRYAIFPSIHSSAGAGVSVGTNGVSVFEHSGNYLPSPLVHDTDVLGWTHIAVVYRDRQPRLYLNGALVREGLRSNRSVVPGWHFGDDGSKYGPYKGYLDEVRIYDRALSEAEISVLAARPRSIPARKP